MDDECSPGMVCIANSCVYTDSDVSNGSGQDGGVMPDVDDVDAPVIAAPDAETPVSDGGRTDSAGTDSAPGVSDAGPPIRDAGRPSSEGFTSFSPDERSRIVYVSDSAGDDSNDGLSPESAVRTIQQGASLIRDGEFDFLLLRRGDTWRGGSLGRFVSGRDSMHPVVVAGYGDGPRPIIRATPYFLRHSNVERNFQALLGLEIVDAEMDPEDPAYDPSTSHGISLIGGGDSILIEDCLLRYVEIVVQSFDGKTYSNIAMRRNIIRDAWALNTTTSQRLRPSGLFASGVDGLVIEENIWDHNGWNDDIISAGRNQYNHNMYIQYSNVGNSVVVRNNIVTRASSHGVHGRPGGLYENNYFEANAVSLQMGYNGHPLVPGTLATARNNVITNGQRMDTTGACTTCTSAVWGLVLNETGQGTFVVEDNIASNRTDSGNNSGITNASGDNISVRRNIQHEWGGGIGDMPRMSSWVDPDRDLASYNASLGGASSMEAFLEIAMSRPWGTWDHRYTAQAINAYIREGFGL